MLQLIRFLASPVRRRYLRVSCRCLLLFILPSWGALLQAQTVTISDGVFSPGNWTTTMESGNGAALSAQQATGGNPGEYLRVDHVNFTQDIFASHYRTSATYNPATQGAIQYVDFSIDQIAIINLSGIGVAVCAAVKQNGKTYYSNSCSVNSGSSWQTFSLTAVPPDYFRAIADPNDHPDFSATGSQIQFGFLTQNSNINALASRAAGFDNWSVTVHWRAASPGLFQVAYASNLNVGDAMINITNTGAMGAGLQAGTAASITGSICANVYAFSPDEQLVSCCSCPVTPNGLRALSANRDLIGNTLTPATPTSIVIKLLGTVPAGGSCTNSAANVLTLTQANGLVAWGTSVHSAATPPLSGQQSGPFTITQRAFVPATLSTGELSRLGTLCNFILANGSGYGVCKSCQLGGLGASKQ
jgi:hypothetical protein